MRLDRLRAEEQGGSGFSVRGSLRDDERDLELLRGQLIGSGRVAPASRLAARAQLDTGTLGPLLRIEALEGLERGAERLARI